MHNATNPDRKEIMRILREHGATLERTKKHKIWRFPDGRIHVMPGSPSYPSAWKNQLHDLRKFLGLNSVRGIPRERRQKQLKTKRILPLIYNESAKCVVLRDMQAQLKALQPCATPQLSNITSPQPQAKSIVARFIEWLKKVISE